MSWVEFRDVLHWLPNTGESALFRALNPADWVWADPRTRLLADIASIGSRQQFLTAAQLFRDVEAIPDEYLPVSYGPPEPAAEPEPESPAEPVVLARSVAAELRGATA